MPILDLAIHGDVIASAGGDGSVRTWRLVKGKLKKLTTLHEAPKKPITALAATKTGFIGAGASLLSWSTEGKVLAKATLPGVASKVVVRGESVYVLAAGQLLSFSLPKLKPEKKWKHAKGTACELDVSDDGKRAIIVRDRKQVEVIDLAKKKSVGDWTRKGRNIETVSACFGRRDEILSVCDGEYRLSRVKDTTGRITGEILWLDAASNGPMVLDRARGFVAVCGAGENVELVELGVDPKSPARTVFCLDPRITDASAKSLAGLKRIPTFKAIAPGFFVRHSSVEAPPTPSTLSAMAVSEGGGLLAAGYVTGELVVADTKTAAVVSSTRGVLSEPRERMRVPVSDIAASAFDGNELWLLQNDGRFLIIDVEKHTRRDGPKLQFEFEGALSDAIGGLTLTSDSIISLDGKRVLRWSRNDGSLVAERELPDNKGGYLEGNGLVLLPLASLGHEGFDIVSFDISTGETTKMTHFERDAARFALGNDPHGWVSFGRTGTTPTLTIWAGKGLTVAQGFTFDVATGKLGRAIPWAEDAEGELGATPDFSNPLQPGDAVKITRVETGEEILRCAYEPTDSPRTSTAAIDPETKYVAARIGDPQIAVWRPDARRLVLDGHRDPRELTFRGKTLVATDRFWMRLWDLSD